jgi:anaerobic magnesium-protoporphyrin IX monomethyl ester cyclase
MTKKIALIQPRIETGASLGIEKAPSSIQSLAAGLKQGHDEVRMFHSSLTPELREKLKQFAPDIVGISTMTPNFPEGQRIAQAIKEMREDILIVLGGWHASGCAKAYKQGQETESFNELIAEDSPFDYIVTGEGELVFPELIRRFEQGEKIDELAGVGLNVAERIKDLNILEDPSWEGLNIDEYRDQRIGSLDLSVHMHRACRFNCGFCSTGTVYGKGVSNFSPERTVNYLKHLIDTNHPEIITFTDEDFFANIAWVEKLVELLEKSEIKNVKFDTFASLNDLIRIDKNLLKRMKKVGFNIFTVGIESFNATTLRKYNKEKMILAMFTPQEKEAYQSSSKEDQDTMLVENYYKIAQKVISKANDHGILITGDYILGNLEESEEDVRKGFEKFSTLQGLFRAYLPTFTPFPGTKLWKEAYDSGKLVRNEQGNIDWEKFDASEGALKLNYDIASLRNELEVEFYTSARFQKDMYEILTTRPELKAMFIGRFNYLKKKFGVNIDELELALYNTKC